MLTLLEFFRKNASLVHLGLMLIFLVVIGGAILYYRHEVKDLSLKNDALIKEKAELSTKLDFQNSKVLELQKAMNDYQGQLDAAKKINDTNHDLITQKNYEIQKLKLPVTCEGKVLYLKNKLIEFGHTK